ncbi:MAG: RNA polymerase sigma factor [Bacteroidaceae bacterium]
MILQGTGFLNFKSKTYCDAEVVAGLQARNRNIEEWFYETSRRYFNKNYNDVFFDKDRKQEVFQESVVCLWTEIENRKITLDHDTVVRQQPNGEYEPMSCNLMTFLLSIARNVYREIVRNIKEEYDADVYNNMTDDCQPANVVFNSSDEVAEGRARVVDEAIEALPPGCREILILFYYKGKSLDEIMKLRKDKNSSKNGLKSAKTKCLDTLKIRVEEQFRRLNLI